MDKHPPEILGEALIGGRGVRGSGTPFAALAAASGAPLTPGFTGVGPDQVALACELAGAAFDSYRATSDEARAAFLEAIADEIVALGDSLVERAMLETGLPQARIVGERGRTVGQLQLFARLLRDGSWRQVTIDSALPERTPPRPDIRLGQMPLGPVVVFGASNFPLAFSVAGGDTASALAAGCPVVVKGHPAHPGTSELVGRAIARAVLACGMPAATFALLPGADNGVGEALARHPLVAAIGFTGSRQGGLALLRIAQARARPIPVYAEMSAINPVFLLPHALGARTDTLARDFVASLTMGGGQVCTNPGLVVAVRGAALERFCSLASGALAACPAATMLSPAIGATYVRGVAQLAAGSGVRPLGRSAGAASATSATSAASATSATVATIAAGQGALFITSARDFLADDSLAAEVFGPASLIVACDDLAQMRQVAEHLEGQLTATLQIDSSDYDSARELLPVLERKVGRIVANGFPTGVEVSTAMVHGGPYPATSDGRSTSVGAAAIYRFVRPLAYQNLPQELLAPALRDAIAAPVWRRRDGVMTQQ